jgi:hypothetical protein
MPKAPPRLPKIDPPPRGTRLYGHVHGNFDVQCPGCGVINTFGGGKGIRRDKGRRKGYDPLSTVMTCRQCRRSYYVGLILWPRGKGIIGRPEDHVPQGSEIEQLRIAVGMSETKTARQPVNLACTCGAGCPVHEWEGDQHGGRMD